MARTNSGKPATQAELFGGTKSRRYAAVGPEEMAVAS